MKLVNLRLRHRLSDVESQLLQLETDSSSNRRSSTRLKEERQRRLIKEKLTIQDSLRLIVYPIFTVPVELTSEIFLHCLPAVYARPSTKLAPLLLGQICRTWRDIAYADPRLWASLTITSWGGVGLQRLVQDWFRRAGSVPLSLSLTLPHNHCPFFKRYSCHCPSSSLFTDHYGHLTSFCGDNFTGSDCIALLVLTPRLTRCKFSSIIGSFPRDPTRLVLIDLQDLTLTSWDTESVSLLLDELTLPELRSLTLDSSFLHFIDKFLSFIHRAPRIHAFSIQSCGTSPDGAATTILHAMPTLRSFELAAYTSGPAFDILRLLNESATFLPRLQKLRLSASYRMWEAHFTPILLEALRSRWEAKSGSITQLVDFRFLFTTGAFVPDAKLLDGVSKLIEQGMRIEVSGT
ncbi:hypothetical protein K438DRAFT_1798327 [Mycena galopus ATCC 62051]|nr:hypothetical protein K438DRAFT_1798327 [Mycena galopus ATCC 62051]